MVVHVERRDCGQKCGYGEGRGCGRDVVRFW